MKLKHLSCTLLVFILSVNSAQSQEIDTLIDVDGYKLHFHIIRGHGMPILFESGGGDGAAIWDTLLKPLSTITGATLITYDRPGFGKSELKGDNHQIVNTVKGLETALHAMGYKGDILLSAHSLGGFYATLFAARNPSRVKGAVLIDAATTCFFTEPHQQLLKDQVKDLMEQFKKENRGVYYIYEDMSNTVEVMHKTSFPAQIPLIDIVSGGNSFPTPAASPSWKSCHQQFVNSSPRREGITATATGHYVFLDNPALVINAIVKTYAQAVSAAERARMLQRSLDYSTVLTNSLKMPEPKYPLSEYDLNEWGYLLLRQKKIQEAIEVFKLNITFFPHSDNCYDSLADAYETAGEKSLAIVNYKRSLEINPKNEHSADRLKILQRQ